jgi:uncharacterized protein YkwD
MKGLLFYSLLIITLSVFTASKTPPPSKKVQLTQEELKLYNLINNYRASNGLKAIPLSTCLTEVAHLHVRDLEDNHPDQEGCNLHSWSQKGKWQSCCYTPDHAQKQCMWNKPKELTSYPGNGFEIAAQYSEPIDAKQALILWKGSQYHNEVLLNKGVYKREWKAMGIGIYKNYSVVWFGHETDSNGVPLKP